MESLSALLKMTMVSGLLAYINKRLELETKESEIKKLKKRKKDLLSKMDSRLKKASKKKLSNGLTLGQVIGRDMLFNKDIQKANKSKPMNKNDIKTLKMSDFKRYFSKN